MIPEQLVIRTATQVLLVPVLQELQGQQVLVPGLVQEQVPGLVPGQVLLLQQLLQ
jgi:hypothetical protein